MGEQTIEFDAEVTVDVSPEEMSRSIGEQLIMENDVEREFAYLAGLSFDGMKNEYDIVEILMEYLRNEQSIDLSDQEEDLIEAMLTDAYDR